MKEIKELTGLRFIAALYVFLFHLQLRDVLPDFGWRINNIISQGAIGVNIFFVLSGLVLTYSSMNSQRNPGFRSFILKRLIRVAPVFLAGLCAAIVVVFVLHATPQNLPVLILLNLTFLNAWVPPLAMQWYSSGSWSISVEIFFYSLFPFLLPYFLHLQQRTIILLLLTAFVLAAIPGFLHTTHPYFGLFTWVYSFPPARLPEFICGILIAVLVFRFNWRVPSWAAIISVFIFLVYLAYFGKRISGFVGHNWLLLPVLSMLIVSLCQDRSIWFRWLSSSVMTYLGRISYGFYIWQIVLMIGLEILGERHLVAAHSFKASLLVLSLNLGLAALSYHLLESRAHRWLSGKLQARTRS